MNKAEELSSIVLEHLTRTNQREILGEVVDRLQKELFRSHDITVVSATRLSKTESDELTKNLTKKWGEHEVEFLIDPSLLSGIIVRFQDQIIDMSGKHNLSQLEQELVKSI